MTDVPRVLLIEQVDAIGAAPSDGSARVTALRSAGAQVELAVLELDHTADLLYETCERAPRSIHTRHTGARALESLAAAVQESRVDAVVWASAGHGGGEAATRVLDKRPAVWWPTGVADPCAVAGPLIAGVPAVGLCADSTLEAPRSPRARLPLWDGPYVLAIASPAGRDVAGIVAAFAHAAADRDDLELVILGDPHPALSQLAALHDVLPRVHCVGRAPREAETCWLQTAACTVVSSEAALSGGLLLRALASGRPLMAACGSDTLHDWLQRERLAWEAPDASLSRRLDHALRAGASVEMATSRAIALAARHDAGALARRAAHLLEGIGRRVRRAA